MSIENCLRTGAVWMLVTDQPQSDDVRTAYGYPIAEPYSESTCCNAGTFTHILGYFPGVSVIVGFTRILFASMALQDTSLDNKDKEQLKLHISRGVIEVFCVFGIILLVVDIVKTCWPKKNPGYELLE
ncbi:MAG: hypothetical protein H0X51_09285 [Parachlamydiaceae bacterium]|nr:hypothetical protein [Parachlamydiaceae bacterium]